MPDRSTFPPAVLLMGPTASGKSALAVELAAALDGEIISVDSALVYRGMDIGTAKPSMAERQGIPHHLIDILDPAEAFSTGQFRAQALKLMDAMTRRGKLPVLAGGTMLYFNALIQGLAALPKADPAIRARLDEDLRQLGSAALHQRLREIDPDAAARIHPNDPQRIQRALEVFEASGMPLSSFFEDTSAQPIPYRLIKLIIAPEERATLHGLIAERFRKMVRDGLIEEVDALYRRGDLSEKMPSIRAVGYRQVWAYLSGEYGYDTMVEKGIIATRQLAKRQFTWLRRDTNALRYPTGQSGLAQQALADIQRLLG
jgi:tRNA dimethylallyltransferase